MTKFRFFNYDLIKDFLTFPKSWFLAGMRLKKKQRESVIYDIYLLKGSYCLHLQIEYQTEPATTLNLPFFPLSRCNLIMLNAFVLVLVLIMYWVLFTHLILTVYWVLIVYWVLVLGTECVLGAGRVRGTELVRDDDFVPVDTL